MGSLWGDEDVAARWTWAPDGDRFAVVCDDAGWRNVRGPLSTVLADETVTVTAGQAGLRRARASHVLLVGAAAGLWRKDLHMVAGRVGVWRVKWLVCAVMAERNSATSRAVRKFAGAYVNGRGLTELSDDCVACGAVMADWDRDGMPWCARHLHHPLARWATSVEDEQTVEVAGRREGRGKRAKVERETEEEGASWRLFSTA